jgi:hypothetical protein
MAHIREIYPDIYPGLTDDEAELRWWAKAREERKNPQGNAQPTPDEMMISLLGRIDAKLFVVAAIMVVTAAAEVLVGIYWAFSIASQAAK